MPDTAEHDPGFSVTGYFELVEQGYLEADDRVELLEGLIVASPPQGPLHASVIMRVEASLRRAVGERATIRSQMPLIVGSHSVPEPDVAIVRGTADDYEDRHPGLAMLVVEIAESSLPQDRLTKSRIYARAGIPEYWIVNLRDRCLEALRAPDSERRLYASVRRYAAGEIIDLVQLSDARIAVADLLPRRGAVS